MARKDDALEQSGTDQFQETDRSSHRTHLASKVAARSQTGSCLVEEGPYLRCEVSKSASTATSRGGGASPWIGDQWRLSLVAVSASV